LIDQIIAAVTPTAFEWETEANKIDIDPEHRESISTTEISRDENEETASLLTELSENKDVPNDSKSMISFLQKAMSSMAEFVKRGKTAASHGIKATYQVKIGQKRSRQTEAQHTQKRRVAKLKGTEGRNQLTRWFKPKVQGESGEEEDDKEVDIYALKEEGECLDDDEDSAEEEEEEEDQVSVPSVGIGSSNVQFAHVSLLRNPLGSLSVFSCQPQDSLLLFHSCQLHIYHLTHHHHCRHRYCHIRSHQDQMIT